jgi:PAS domain S-box-containing protein
MAERPSEEELLRAVALQNMQSIMAARHRAEEKLAESAAVMGAPHEASAGAILAVDAEARVTHFNRHYLDLVGVRREAAEGSSHPIIAKALANQMRWPQAYIERIDEIYATTPPETHDVLEFGDGRVVERYSRAQHIEGRGVGRVWTFRDVTQRRRAEEALREETRLLEIVNRTGASLASSLELDTLVQTLVDAATQLAGAEFGAFFYNVLRPDGPAYQLSALTGARREEFDKLGHPRITAVFGSTFRGQAIERSEDITQDPRYGKSGPHYGMPRAHLPVRSYLAVPVKSRSGEVIGGLFLAHSRPAVFGEKSEQLIVSVAAQAAVAIDNARLYERERAARAEAERMSALKDEFLATLSHELRTPLGAILGWAQVLRRRTVTETELHGALDVIERNARIQTQLIEDLLDMSRITSGKVRLDIQPVEPVTFIESAMETVRPSADAKGVRLEKVLDPAAGPVSGDPHRLQQVLWNLLSNAIKFTPKGGKIQVLLERVNSHVEISVADTGMGIKPDFLPHMFERFRQADGSTTRSHGGLGLGLSIVKSLVELHGGSVRAHSAGEGRGTTFSVLLPLAAVRRGASESRLHPAATPATSAFLPADLTGLAVLVVDDHDDARQLLSRVLGECGARVFSAASAREALVLVAKERPDVMVSDIGMPGADGYELLRQVRELGDRQGGRLRAIALTAFARSEDRTRALRAGFLAHVAKPVDASELVATIATVAGRTA